MKKVVMALGGNAILTDNPTAKAQEDSLKATAKKIKSFLGTSDSIQLIVSHGNGPQVGNLLLQELNGSTPDNPPMPLDVVGAMTQGEIGAWLTNAFSDCGLDAATIVTRTLVNADDPAFKHPSKPIGPFYKDGQKVKKEHPDWDIIEDSGRGYRRVVPSPLPQDILEKEQINNLVRLGNPIVAGGGGGVPVVKTSDGDIQGVEAVIDKDFTSALIAKQVCADGLIILTAVDQVAINFGRPDQEELTDVDVPTLEKYLKEGQFGKGSMEPKVKACIDFVNATGKTAVITSLNNVGDFMENKKATFITK